MIAREITVMPLHVSIDAAFCIASNQDMNQLNGSNDTCSLRISHSDKVNVENRRRFDSTELKSERGRDHCTGPHRENEMKYISLIALDVRETRLRTYLSAIIMRLHPVNGTKTENRQRDTRQRENPEVVNPLTPNLRRRFEKR